MDKAPRLLLRLRGAVVRGARQVLCLWLAWQGAAAAAGEIVEAVYDDPTTRYPHGVLGDTVEWGALRLRLDDGREVTFELPQDHVFEDVAPRLADLDGDGGAEVIVVEADARAGAALAVYDETGKVAETPHIGTRFRWLAPLGAADLDGDDVMEIAYIDRPHLAKTLRIWRFADGRLTEVAALRGLTNHRIGEVDIAGGIRDCGAGPEMILATANWGALVALRWSADGFVQAELGRDTSRTAFATAMACG